QPGGGTGGTAWAQQPVVTVEDALGNTKTSGTGSAASVTVVIGTNLSSGTLGGTKTVTALGGIATFTNLLIDKSGSGYTLTVTSTTPTITGQPASSAFNITVGSAAKLAYGQQPTATTAGPAISPDETVQSQDVHRQVGPRRSTH